LYYVGYCGIGVVISRRFVVPCAYLGNKITKYELFPEKMAENPAIFLCGKRFLCQF